MIGTDPHWVETAPNVIHMAAAKIEWVKDLIPVKPE
jgi:hypothetical protein